MAKKAQAKVDVKKAETVTFVDVDGEEYEVVSDDYDPDASTETEQKHKGNPDPHPEGLASLVEPEGPMTLADVHAILADTYPGYSPIEPRGSADGLLFTLPPNRTLIVERKRVKAAANMEELRAYVDSLT